MPYNVDLPHFSGDGNEQLAQMQRYLYRQAEQLGYALNNIDRSISDDYTPAKSTLNTNEIMKKFGDYVIETGTASGWHYKKWQGGTYEMYGGFAVTPTSSKRGPILYITNDIAIPTPFEIAIDAVVTGTAEGNLWITDGKYAAARAISIKIMSDNTISTSEAIIVRLHVVGAFETESGEASTLSLRRNVGAYVINTEE